jgi:hypothetical protein
MTYFRAIDPFPLEAADWNKLHEFYARLADGRLATTRCTACGDTAWPPRGFCGNCAGDGFDWVDLPRDGVVHAFTVQDTGLPVGFDGPRVFAIIKLGGHRIFTILVNTDPARVRIGQPVTLKPLRVADDPRGGTRWLAAFTAV